MDYRALGLKVGLEIHQQLATHKLFCEDASGLVDDPGGLRFRRRLRPTQSELGEVDAAAIEEAKRHLTFVYEATPNSCLVEADEEPPHPPNPEALDIAIEIAQLMSAMLVSEVDFMRKIVIDGSNTAGFQRSALVAMDGYLDVNGKRIGVPTILLEEDAARKLGEAEGEVVYRLDRLGIPLVEVATTPNIETPDEAREVALAFGSLLRATRKVMRGIGTIREDLNVSIEGGARVEIKGVQDLRLISTFVEIEAERQRMLLEVGHELARRGVDSVPSTVHDVTSIFRPSQSKVVQAALKKGGKVLAWSLPGFAGLLKGKLGPELAAHARVTGVAGIFHSDELPAYGIGDGEIDGVRAALRLNDLDAFVLVAEDERKARLAFDEMRPRATAAIQGVPPETREPRPDGTTAYSRPLPGKARMYPETDVPPIRVTKQRLERIRKGLPERPEVTVSRLLREYGIHEQQARQLVQEGTNDSFELIAREFGEAKLVATVLLYTFPELRREGLAVDAIPLDNLRELFSLLKAGRFAKEAVPDLLREMARRGTRASDAIERLGVRGLTREAVEAIVDEILTTSHDLVASRGEDAEKALMGRVMEKVRGRADGQLVSEVLHSRLESRLKGEAKEGKKGKRKKAPQRD
jgi:glutamyl-tRNA(Gln) amidotransferase subunit E